MSMTDKQVFEILKAYDPDIVRIWQDRSFIAIDVKGGSCRKEGFRNMEITWTHPSKKYPPPKDQLEPCRYCKVEMREGVSGKDVHHPATQNNCPLSNRDFFKSDWPRVKPAAEQSSTTPKESLPVHTTPSLESLGLDPAEVWSRYPKATTITIDADGAVFAGTGESSPVFGIAVWKGFFDSVELMKAPLPPGVDWKKCIWHRPKCLTCLDSKTIKSGWGCPDCGNNGGIDVKVKCMDCNHEYNIDKDDTRRCPKCDSLSAREASNG